MLLFGMSFVHPRWCKISSMNSMNQCELMVLLGEIAGISCHFLQ